MSERKMRVIAACDHCGRGYILLNHDGVRCLANDGGRVWRLKRSQPMDDDSYQHRQRRLRLLRKARPNPSTTEQSR